MIRTLAALAIVIGFAGSVLAQGSTEKIVRPITKEGSAAFMATLGGLGTFNLASAPLGVGLSNAGFGMKYFISDNVALRALLGLSMSTTSPDEGDDATINGFGIGLGGEYHFAPLYSTSPYIGAQLGFSSTSSENQGGNTEAVMQSASSTFPSKKSSETAIAFHVLAGFNWFCTEAIAIGAEYSLGLTTTSGSFTPVSGTEEQDMPSTTSIGFGGAGAVNLAIYF